MVSLSDRQRDILQFIIQFVQEHEYPPTIREIGDRVSISSTSVVNYNLNKLAEAELLSRHSEISRGISLNWERIAEVDVDGALGLATMAAAFGNGDSHDGSAEAERVFRVPLLGHIAAGEPIQVETRDQAGPEDWVELSEQMLNTLRHSQADRLFALRVQGDSMMDASVLDGDIVILRHQERAENGEMVAVWIEGDEETTLKKWQLKGSEVHLIPANPSYQPIVRKADQVRVKGKVVSVIRNLA